MPDYTVNENSDVYYDHGYWNELVPVIRWMCSKISGNDHEFWVQQFKRSAGRRLGCALVLNCGNGNIEREMWQHEIFDSVIGIDYSTDLLSEAERAANAASLPFEYVQMDTNSAAFPDRDFELVINNAAAHHIAYIDRVFRELCRRLPDDGWLVQFDYVGPHRNQYSYRQWQAIAELNASLPPELQRTMTYPHLPTMMLADPTEAIHSELIMPTTRRYFDLVEEVRIGGAIAYPFLTHHPTIYQMTDEERDPWIKQILEADDAFLLEHPDENLFSYVSAHPNKRVLEDAPTLARWTLEEDERERLASTNGGEYYPHTVLQEAYLDHERLRLAAETSQAQAQALADRFPNPQMQRLLSSRGFDRLRSSARGERIIDAVRRVLR